MSARPNADFNAADTAVWPVWSGWQWRAWPDGRLGVARGGWAPTEEKAERRAQAALEEEL